MKEQFELWPEEARRAREKSGEDWRPDGDATRSEGESTYRTIKKDIKRFLRNTARNLKLKEEEKTSQEQKIAKEENIKRWLK